MARYLSRKLESPTNDGWRLAVEGEDVPAGVEDTNGNDIECLRTSLSAEEDVVD